MKIFDLDVSREDCLFVANWINRGGAIDFGSHGLMIKYYATISDLMTSGV